MTPAKATLDLPANQVATAHFVLSVPLNISDGTTEFITIAARSLKTGREQVVTVRVQVGQAIDGFGKVGEVNNQFIGEIGLSVNYPTALEINQESGCISPDLLVPKSAWSSSLMDIFTWTRG